MPITVQVPEGLLTAGEEEAILRGLTEAVLEVNGVAGNFFAREHLIADIATLPQRNLFRAGKQQAFVNVTLRVPTFSLDTRERREAFVTRMTEVIVTAADGKFPRERIYINMIYGDGFWGIGGTTYDDDDLKAAIAASPAA